MLFKECIFTTFSKHMKKPISAHVFLFTSRANFLSNKPSLSSGYNSISFLAITKPSTLSPKNSNFSLLHLLS